MSIKSIALLGYYNIARLHIQYKYRHFGGCLSMIDYKGIGIRIRDMRKMKKMTQEQLAEAAGVGVTHISHIETGNSVPSLQVMVDIINALDCSADELLCVEIDQARPLVNCWLSELVDDCSGTEIKLISDVVISLKSSMRRLKIDGQ